MWNDYVWGFIVMLGSEIHPFTYILLAKTQSFDSNTIAQEARISQFPKWRNIPEKFGHSSKCFDMKTLVINSKNLEQVSEG